MILCDLMSVPSFTSNQKIAIEHTKGNLQIIACAGSGKTETVSRRIANLVKQGEPASSIVAFTFSEKAAEELKARIRRILDQECPKKADFGEMYIGTIHSFCMFMLKELEPKYKGFDVLDEAKRVAFVSVPDNYYGKLRLVGFEKEDGLGKYKIIRKFLSSADVVRAESVNPSKLGNERFAKALEDYISLLDEEHYFDFESLIDTLVRLLDDRPEMKKQLNERVKHLIVDEYQDVNRLQEKLISLMAKGCTTLCVVGDDDQCIYNWRGSEIDNIRLFSRRYPKVTQIPLEENFRSTAGIIHSAASLIRNNQNRIEKTMKPPVVTINNYEEGDLTVQHYEAEAQELESIPVKIAELMGADFMDRSKTPVSLSLGDIAILTRTNEDAAKVSRVLDEHGIQCIVVGGESVFTTAEVTLSLNCLRHLFLDESNQTASSRPDSLSQAYASVFAKKNYPEADPKKFSKRLLALKQEVEKIKTKEKDYLAGGIQPFYLATLECFGAGDFEFSEALNYNLAVLSEAISDYETVWKRLKASQFKYFNAFVSAYAFGRYSEKQHNDVGLIDAVKVMTVHRAKGLEFPVVFMPGLVKKRTPNPELLYIEETLYPKERYIGNEDDERRVWYTAMTRSMKYLFLSSSKKREGRTKDYQPHPFIEEIDRKYFSEHKPLQKKRSGHPKRIQATHFLPTSFSEISAFERCGYEYQLRHVFGYNVGVPTAFGYGAQIHNLLNIIHKKYKGKPPTEKQIEELFEHNFYMRYALGKALDGFRKAALTVVKNYVRLHGKEFGMVLQTEKNFELMVADALVTGQIDLLKKIDAKGNVAGIEIVDFKTENTSEYNPNHELQLRLYALACLESLGLDPKKATVHHLDKNTREEVDISKPALEKTKQTIKLQIDGIAGHKFKARPKQKLCVACDYKNICPNRYGK